VAALLHEKHRHSFAASIIPYRMQVRLNGLNQRVPNTGVVDMHFSRAPVPGLMDTKTFVIMERQGEITMSEKQRKHEAPPRYDESFKAGAVRMVTEQGRPSREAASELGICIDTLRSWLKTAGAPSPGQAGRQNRRYIRILVRVKSRADARNAVTASAFSSLFAFTARAISSLSGSSRTDQ